MLNACLFLGVVGPGVLVLVLVLVLVREQSWGEWQ